MEIGKDLRGKVHQHIDSEELLCLIVSVQIWGIATRNDLCIPS